jgi:hypothetical protein
MGGHRDSNRMGNILPGCLDSHLLGGRFPGYQHRSLKKINNPISLRLGDESARRVQPENTYPPLKPVSIL